MKKYLRGTLESRFLNGFRVGDPNECWVWLRGKNKAGYGIMREGGKTVLAHRVSYTIFNNTPLDGGLIDHICRNRSCVNPRHLRICTRSQNKMNSCIQKNKLVNMKGVTRFNRDKKPFVARITMNGITRYIGGFDTELEAHAAYVKSAKELFGEFFCEG